MLSKQAVRDAVYALLAQEAEERLLAKNPDLYYGWVPPTDDQRGYWLGEPEVRAAEYAAAQAAEAVRYAGQATWKDPDNPELIAAYEAAKQAATAAVAAVGEAQAYADRAMTARRKQVVDRMVAKEFLRTHAKAMRTTWPLFDPSVPQSLRDYAQRQLARGPLAPVSLVFLYLTVCSTVSHGQQFQTEALTGHDYLADNPLAVSSLDIDVPEDRPAQARRAYIRELQASAVRDRRQPAHENRDPRDVLADFEYHGLPEQLKALWIAKDDDNSCDHCKQGLRTRLIHYQHGYRYATVCPNYADNPQCHYDLKSPTFRSRKVARQWAQTQLAMHQAA